VPALDASLATIVSQGQAFQLVSAVVKAANWNAYDAKALANAAFTSIPKLKQKAHTFAIDAPIEAAAVLQNHAINLSVADFSESYL